MLTRLQVDGFKTFENLDVSFDPFSLIIGSNAAGKSNLFDVLQLLSSLAEKDVRESLRSVRGEPQELFRETNEGRVRQIRLAVEVLVDASVEDFYGSRVEISNTRMRYELVLERRSVRPGLDQVYVVSESATAIRLGHDNWAPKVRKAADRSRYLRYTNRKTSFLETIDDGSSPLFSIKQDGKQGRDRPADAAAATVLYGVTNSAEFPHLFALREEMRSWKLLQLDPSLLRKASPAAAADELESDGSNLAAVLTSIKTETATSAEPKGRLALISRQLASLVTGISGIDAQFDEGTKEFTLELCTRDGARFSSRVASDGTLRILALLSVLNSPRRPSLILFEEPENGIHPARVKRLIEIVESTVSRLDGDSGADSLTQLIVNSHSPIVLDALVTRNDDSVRADHGTVLFADIVSVLNPGSEAACRKSRFRRVRRGTGEIDFHDDSGPAHVSDLEVLSVLDTVGQDG